MNAIHELQQTSILIVDDDLLTQSIIKAELESIGYHNIQTEDDGFVALDMLRKNASINLIVLDLHMPKIDGVRFMRQLAAIRPTTDIILASGQRGRLLSTTISLGKSMGLNVLGALQKPVQVQALEELLERRQVQQNSLERIEDVRLPLLVADLRDGILGDRIDNHPHLMFQPIVSVATRSIVSVEVLARWWNRERGILTPELFLPLAEKQGLLDQLTRQIYLMTIEQVAEWFTAGQKLSAAVNLSINSFNDKSFAPFLIATAEQYGIDCARLIFEVAESQTSSVTPDCLEALLSLRLKGFRLSIDDFGTGSSSFTHVKNIPFTELKIDREFVTGAAIDSVARSILEESIKLAQRLHMAVVAEGVETRNEWCLAEQLGCDFVQGYYCAKPMDNKALQSFLDEWRGPHDNPDRN